MTEFKRPFAPGKYVYDEETFFKISELPVCSVYPDFLSTEFCSEFDGPNGPVRLWCPNRWIQNIWHQEELDKLKNKGHKSAAINIPDGEGRKETLDRLKTESEDGIVLSPQRRSFGAGCQAGLNRSTKDNIRDNARHMTNTRNRNSGRSHRYDNWRDHSASSNLSSRAGGKDFSTKQRNITGNNWSFQRNEKKESGSGSSSAIKESMPEWVTNGPKDMFDTVELRGFDDDEPDPRNASDDSSAALVSNGDHETNVHSGMVESKPSESDFHAETDAILTRFLGLSANGQPGKSRFCQFFEQSAAADTKSDNKKPSNDTTDDSDPLESSAHVHKQEPHSVGSLPGALRLEDIESAAAALTENTIRATAAVQGLFESFKCDTKEESHERENSQRTSLQRDENLPTIPRHPFDKRWSNGIETDAARIEHIHPFSGGRGVDNSATMSRPYGQQQSMGWKPPMPGHQLPPGFHAPIDGGLYGGRAPFHASDRGCSVLPSAVHMPHQRNIPLDVINAMMEMKEGKPNSVTEYLAAIGFQSRDVGPLPPGKMQPSEQPLPRMSNMMPTSVLRQMHHEKMSNAQIEANPELEAICSESAVPTFAAVAASGTKSAPVNSMAPLVPLKMPPWGSGRSPQMSPQNGVRLATQQRLLQESWRMPSFVQQVAGYPIMRSSGLPPPQCSPVAMQMLRARMLDAQAQRMLAHNAAALRMSNGPPPPPPSAPFDPRHPHPAMLIQQQLLQQYRMPQNNLYYASAYSETNRSVAGGTIPVNSLFKMANMGNTAPLPLDGKALTLEEIENQAKANRPVGNIGQQHQR